jgi:dTDP-4-dehydrorhamnose 3,5-epimerase-like enzyme
MEVKLIPGELHVDQRGIVSFVNDFDFKGVDRFYTVKAHKTRELRGWIGHRKEHKWFTALTGALMVAVVAPDDWENPSMDLPVKRFILSALKPAILHVPPGHANASLMLTQDALLGIFSSGKIENAVEDDWRFDVDTWAV